MSLKKKPKEDDHEALAGEEEAVTGDLNNIFLNNYMTKSLHINVVKLFMYIKYYTTNARSAAIQTCVNFLKKQKQKEYCFILGTLYLMFFFIYLLHTI